MDEQLYEAHDKLVDTYWWFVGRRAVIREVLRRRLPVSDSSRRVLDLGCGSGGNLAMLSEFGRVTGVESSERPLEGARLRARGDTRLVCGEFPAALPDDAKFELICALDVIEHLDDPVKALSAAHERLSPGGRLVVTVPAFPFLWSVHDDQNHHRRRYLRSTLVEHLEQAGFTTEWSSYYNTVLFPAVAAVRIARHLLPLGDEATDFEAPTQAVNSLLARVFTAESRVVPRVSLPFGVSLIAIASATSPAQPRTAARRAGWS